MSGNYSRRKGQRFEREVVHIFQKYDIPVKRISMMETGNIDKGDVKVDDKHILEVKGGSQVPKFLYTATKDDSHWLVCRRDKREWKIVMDLEWFIENCKGICKENRK